MVAKIAAAAALGWVLAGCATAGSPAPAPATSAKHALLGQPIDFKLPLSSGGEQPVPAPGSRATLIEFWVTYCGACGRSLPRMQKLASGLEKDGVKVELVAVLYDDEALENVTSRLREWGVDREFLIDRGGPTWRRFRIHVPGFVVLDSRGVVRWVGAVQAREGDAAAAARAVANGSLQ